MKSLIVGALAILTGKSPYLWVLFFLSFFFSWGVGVRGEDHSTMIKMIQIVQEVYAFSAITIPFYSVCSQLGILYTVVNNFVVSSVSSSLHAGDRGSIPRWDRL